MGLRSLALSLFILLLLLIGILSIFAMSYLGYNLDTRSFSSTSQEVVDLEDNNKVGVVAGNNRGTGFFVDNENIITACHAVKGKDTVRILYDDKTFSADVVDTSEMYDLAYLEVNNVKIKNAGVNIDKSLSSGETVYSFGFKKPTLKSTVRENFDIMRVKNGGYSHFRSIRANLVKGYSGGPTYDEQGNLVGMNFGYLTSSKTGKLSLIVSGRTIEDFIFEIERTGDFTPDPNKEIVYEASNDEGKPCNW